MAIAWGLCSMSLVPTSQSQEQREGSPESAVGMGLKGWPSRVSGFWGCM